MSKKILLFLCSRLNCARETGLISEEGISAVKFAKKSRLERMDDIRLDATKIVAKINKINRQNKINNGVLLEIGCGSGIFLQEMHARMNNSWIFLGCDIDIKMAILAQGHAVPSQKRIHYIVNEAKILPFRDQSVNMIVMYDAFHHIIYPHEILCEIKRVLKDGGRFFLVDIAPGSANIIFNALLYNFNKMFGIINQWREAYLRSALSSYTKNEMKEIFRLASFSKCSVRREKDLIWVEAIK